MTTSHVTTKRIIPSSGERLPIIGLGTWQTFDVGNSFFKRIHLNKVLNKITELGSAVIDSSPMYGTAENVVGDLTARSILRNKLFFATKVWTTGKQEGIDQMNASFAKMKTNVIDLMQVHNLIDVATHLKTLKDWKEEGKVRYIGVSHYTTEAYPDLIQIIKNDTPDFVQFNYSIDIREAEKILLPLCEDKGVAVIINRPFGYGNLFGKIKNKMLPQWAREQGISTWAQFFLKFIVSHPVVTCTIPGTSKVKHLEDNIMVASGELPSAAMREKMSTYFNSVA